MICKIHWFTSTHAEQHERKKSFMETFFKKTFITLWRFVKRTFLRDAQFLVFFPKCFSIFVLFSVFGWLFLAHSLVFFQNVFISDILFFFLSFWLIIFVSLSRIFPKCFYFISFIPFWLIIFGSLSRIFPKYFYFCFVFYF